MGIASTAARQKKKSDASQLSNNSKIKMQYVRKVLSTQIKLMYEYYACKRIMVIITYAM